MNSKKESEINLFDTILELAIKKPPSSKRSRCNRFYRDKQPKDFNKKSLENLNLREVLKDIISANKN